MKKNLLVLVFLAATCNAKEVMTYGAGVSSCGTWIENRKDETLWINTFSWIQGFLAGAETVYSEGSLQMEQTDYVAMTNWVDNYCEANPLDSISDAALSLMIALQELRMKRLGIELPK